MNIRILEKIVELCYNITLKVGRVFSSWGDIIRKLSKHQKEWLNKRNIKIQKKLSQKKRKKKAFKNRIHSHNNNNSNSKNVFTVNTPTVFSIEKNSEETIQFFNKILTKRNEHKFGTHFFINSESVTEVTVDALMFLIAIITDTKNNFLYKYTFAGNFPKEANAKRVFIESGFMAFVQSDSGNKIYPQTDNIQIIKGKTVDAPTAAKVCDFVQKNCRLSRIDTIPLYNILVELMANTTQHAYTERTAGVANYWYLFAEKREGKVNFVFLDTGLGIPTTVRKKLSERIPYINKDSDFIKSALEGEFRTQTRRPNRGKGLPQISECFRSGILQNIFVYAGKGCCTLNKRNQMHYETVELKNKIFGTLFCWQITKCKE